MKQKPAGAALKQGGNKSREGEAAKQKLSAIYANSRGHAGRGSKAIEQKPAVAGANNAWHASRPGKAVKQLALQEVILFPLISEKAVNMIEAENKLCFVVNNKATKADVRKAVEENYSIKVDGIRVLNDMKGRKKAIVKVNKKFKADEIATKLGVI